MKLSGKTILITGGTSGIGLELAKQLMARGNTVIVTGRDEAKFEAVKAALPGVGTFRSDVSRPEEIPALREAVLARFPGLDVLINNAGVMRNLKLREARELRDLTRELDSNLCGPMWMVQEFLPHLATRPGAMIVNVSSGLAFVPFPAAPVYSAAKAGLHAYTQALRVQLAGSGVTVVELAPPAVETPLLRGEFAEEMRGQKAMDVGVLVKRAIAGIERGKLEVRPGLSNVLKLLSRVAPAFALGRIVKMSTPKVPAS